MGRLRTKRQKDLLAGADQIIDPKHPLVPLGDRIDWDFLDSRFRACARPAPASRSCRPGRRPGCSS